MSQYLVKLKSKREIAEGTMAFHFEKPEGLIYKAGQFASCTLINPAETDAEGNTRAFSFASAPYEDELIFAARMRDTAFKRVLKKMEIGTEIAIKAPFGTFTLHDKPDSPTVFLTGGIGITPVRSMIMQAVYDQLPQQILVFYANRRPEDTAFLEDLQVGHTTNPHYTFVGTMADMANSKQEWQGETGFINKGMLLKYIDDLTVPIYYIDGPSAMVAVMRKILSEAGVSDDHIRTEEFSGY
ncbi:ferredoxin--NADP reductase [Methylovulum psychrotolerans]|uniref:NADH:ubiquinone reductase (Na(+)-transporting) subunit F n=1 Tax=Methylovulum psychrotolerans TaxID=1704499 RepID=A0A2S5CIE1_9GAMM|nr:FAD-dependent oxidoreductase [Methylovulum psychrotolerans]POZ50583.1 NADH:ubiquinone reductase (Na(+)-transporting) subunit F [Methylovulum psychrotolerans]